MIVDLSELLPRVETSFKFECFFQIVNNGLSMVKWMLREQICKVNHNTRSAKFEKQPNETK